MTLWWGHLNESEHASLWLPLCAIDHQDLFLPWNAARFVQPCHRQWKNFWFSKRVSQPIVPINHIFLIHSSTDDLLSCCHILTVVNIGVQRSCQANSSNSFACNTSGILGSYNHFSCYYLRYLHIIFHEAVLIHVPTNSVQFFPFILNFISIFPSCLA